MICQGPYFAGSRNTMAGIRWYDVRCLVVTRPSGEVNDDPR